MLTHIPIRLLLATFILTGCIVINVGCSEDPVDDPTIPYALLVKATFSNELAQQLHFYNLDSYGYPTRQWVYTVATLGLDKETLDALVEENGYSESTWMEYLDENASLSYLYDYNYDDLVLEILQKKEDDQDGAPIDYKYTYNSDGKLIEILRIDYGQKQFKLEWEYKNGLKKYERLKYGDEPQPYYQTTYYFSEGIAQYAVTNFYPNFNSVDDEDPILIGDKGYDSLEVMQYTYTDATGSKLASVLYSYADEYPFKRVSYTYDETSGEVIQEKVETQFSYDAEKEDYVANTLENTYYYYREMN